jgi:hypothetical protein
LVTLPERVKKLIKKEFYFLFEVIKRLVFVKSIETQNFAENVA